MKVINELSKEYAKKSKLKRKITVLTIALATCLLTSIGIFAYSMHCMFMDEAVEFTSLSYGAFTSVSKEQVGISKNHSKLKKVGEIINAGDIKKDNNYINVSYQDKDALELNNIKVIKGKIPSKNYEIALDKWFMDLQNLDIGDKFKIDKEEFKVSGVISGNKHNKANKAVEALISKIYAEDKYYKNRSVIFTTEKDYKINETITSIGKDLNIKDKNIKINKSLVNLKEGSLSENIPYIILTVIIVISSIVVIYNIFYISIIERIQTIGLLSCIGFTRKQIKKMIIKEGSIFAMIGIPLGIVLGYALSYLVIPMIQLNNPINIKSSIYTVPVVSIIIFITVYISTLKPARYASKISPIELVRYSEGNSKVFKVKKRESNKNVLSDLAFANLWRNKKRTLLTIISVTLSGMLFIIISTIFSSMSVKSATEQQIKNDFEITPKLSSDLYCEKENLSKDSIKKLNSLEKASFISNIKYITGEIKEKDCQFDVYGYDEAYISKIKKNLLQGKIDANKLKNENLLILQKSDRYDYNRGLKLGDIVELIVYESVSTDKEGRKIYEGKKTIYKFKIAAIVSSRDLDMGWVMGPQFIIHKDNLTGIFKDVNVSAVAINSKYGKEEELNKDIKNIISKDTKVELKSFKEVYNKTKKEKQNIELIGYSIVITIATIGILNFINTIITGIISRKKEFGMLKAIGTTDNQLKSLLLKEGFYYLGIACILAGILGNLLGYFLFTLFKKVASYAIYHFLIIQTISMVFIVFIIEYIVVNISINSITKKSIVDQIRCD
ncbi:TPA: ABC transporter permease [Clostridium botulinum]|nr:ABC transporter permease [Clostridium botulinum]HDK7192270.1 ABC transporter permease [Clostridium botulinum]HDK7203545.1 ABC transporter permease [Clostridium botulinum]HDK7207563.1 ABC transporter permease [Clostridium botulinum]HDK7262721.1 ABC transporter permease [Clostridium botulinum]